jgi:hypothetical protein
MCWVVAVEIVVSFVRALGPLWTSGGPDMGRQQSLDFRGEQLVAIWKLLPKPCRKEAVALWMKLIAHAAQAQSKRKGVAT